MSAPNICLMNSIRQTRQPTFRRVLHVQMERKWRGEINVLFAPFICGFRLVPCVTRCSPQRELRGPVLHAGNILINLEDDSVTLEDDSPTLIRNEATEPRDEWRGRKRASV